jgi:hypothetical protein
LCIETLQMGNSLSPARQITEEDAIMPLLSKPSSSAYASLLYITVGALTGVWSGIWYWYMSNYPPTDAATWYWCYGFLLTGLVLVVIGLAIGPIGRAARHAELPPTEATPAEAAIQQEAAAHPPVAVAAQPIAPVATGQPIGAVRVPSARQEVGRS